jgi:superfamily I DNA and/or RNA helicase
MAEKFLRYKQRLIKRLLEATNYVHYFEKCDREEPLIKEVAIKVDKSVIHPYYLFKRREKDRYSYRDFFFSHAQKNTYEEQAKIYNSKTHTNEESKFK